MRYYCVSDKNQVALATCLSVVTSTECLVYYSIIVNLCSTGYIRSRMAVFQYIISALPNTGDYYCSVSVDHKIDEISLDEEQWVNGNTNERNFSSGCPLCGLYLYQIDWSSKSTAIEDIHRS